MRGIAETVNEYRESCRLLEERIAGLNGELKQKNCPNPAALRRRRSALNYMLLDLYRELRALNQTRPSAAECTQKLLSPPLNH